MRFAVRPAVPRGHRPSEGGLPAVRGGHLIPAPAADRPVAAPGRRTLARFLTAPACDDGGARGLGACVSTALAEASGAAYDPSTLHPTRVLPGRPAACHAEPIVPHLGETTARLLTWHVSEGRPAGAGRPALDAPSAVPEIPRRERRPLPGRRAGVLTPRVR
ncbi:hypothetical protein [Actinoallomurus iriomotensis]|uniref:Uncharacterized protein n=1 Tax=Actinoallomurus iriomotensis TaxID=478107 RepID=A0A9W6RJS2_9ACTN|nr:hypothetical protein [Actinoallomurus iriomotensis]GLY76814.1 hypothetical protein Airi01_050810 [Actinoallomurus iriomotensis]